MKLSVTGHQTAVSDSLRTDISRKLRRIERLLNDNAISAQCVISRQRKSFVCDLTVHARQDHMLHGIGRHERAPAAVAAAVDKIRQQAEKLKGRWDSKKRGSTDRRPAWPDEAVPAGTVEPAPAAPEAPRVIRARRSFLKPMTTDDAIVALAAASQPFVVFRQVATDGLAVLYRRPDGHYGLIDLEA